MDEISGIGRRIELLNLKLESSRLCVVILVGFRGFVGQQLPGGSS